MTVLLLLLAVALTVAVVALVVRSRVFRRMLDAQDAERERLRLILDKSPVGVAIATDGIVRFENPRFAELLGVGVGGDLAAIYTNPRDRQEVLRRLEDEGMVRDFGVSLVSPSGEPRQILLTLMNTEFEGRPAELGWAVDVTHLKQTEEALRRVNFLSDSALDLTKAGYWYIDLRDEGYYEASDRVRDIFGETPKSDRRYHLKDEWWSRINEVDPAAARRVTELFEGAIAGRYDQYDAEYPYRRPSDGKVIWTRARAFVERDAQGNARRMYGVQQDLTEQHAAELALHENEARLDAVVRGANLGLWDVDPASGEILVNEILESQLGYPPMSLRESADKWSPLKGGLQEWTRQLHEDDRAKVADQIARHIAGQDDVYRAEHRVRTADGSYKWILSTGRSARRDAQNRSLRVHGVHIDISDTKRLEALRDSLTHMIVHDLRSPLNAILLSFELLGDTSVPDGKKAVILRRGIASTQALMQMINTLLDVNKMEAGEMPLNRTDGDLRDTVTAALVSLSGLVADRTLVIEREDAPVTASFDHEVMVRVVSNLLANALKFTPKSGKVTVRVGHRRNGACIEVVDTGRGIPAALHARIFEKFSQIEDGKHFGTGLGLTFCKLALEAHGGDIGVESVVGEGSTFWCVLR
jgi:two-component system sensor histidine kinase/response regulator